MEQATIEAMKQVPALVVLVWMVVYFLKYMKCVMKDLRDESIEMRKQIGHLAEALTELRMSIKQLNGVKPK